MLNKQKGNNYNWKLPDVERLKDIYFNEKMSFNEIAKEYGVTKGAIKIKFDRYEIKPRTLSEAQDLKAHHINLSKNAIDFISGLLLGDGCLGVAVKNKKSACYLHTDKHKEYIEYLTEDLAEFDIIVKSNYIHPKTGCHSLRTYYYRELYELRIKWYPNDKKVIPNDLYISPTILKNWYIGDGSFQKGQNGTKKGEKAVICSQFDPIGKERLANQLLKIGIYNSIYPDCIYIKAEGRRTFFQFMLSSGLNIPDCYQYKFPEVYCDT